MTSIDIPAHLASEIATWAAGNGLSVDQAVAELLRKGLGRRTMRDVFPDAETDDDLYNLVFGDGDAGEGVEYTLDGASGDLDHRRVRGAWIFSQSTEADGKWTHDYMVCRDQDEAQRLYVGAIQELHSGGAQFEPDTCPIFDKVEAGWK